MVEESNGSHGVASQTQVMSQIVDALSELIEVVTHTSFEKESTSDGGTSVLDIPDEVLALIFEKYFSYMEISHFKFVCQKFSCVASCVLSSGFNKIQAIITDRLKGNELTSHELELSEQRNKRHVFTLEEYNVLAVLFSVYNLVACLTTCFFDSSFVYSIGFLIDEFMRILSMMNAKNDRVMSRDQCLSLITTRMLCDASKYFLDNILKACSRSEKLQRIELGSMIVSALNCIVNAEYRLVVVHDSRTCDVEGLYRLPGYRVQPPIGGRAPIFLAEWLRELMQVIQDSNTKLLCKRYEEAKVKLMVQIATKREFDSTIDDHMTPFRLGPVTSKRSERNWTHVVENQKLDDKVLEDSETEVNVRLKCAIAESPLFIKKLVDQFEIESFDGNETDDLFVLEVVLKNTDNSQ